MKPYHNHILQIWTNPISKLLLSMPLLFVTGCASLRAGQMSTNGLTMEQTYQQAIVGDGDNNAATLVVLRSHVAPEQTNIVPGKNNDKPNAGNYLDIHRLPNPDIKIYVYPHWAKENNNEIPVPGYWTAFPLYQKIYYDFNLNHQIKGK